MFHFLKMGQYQTTIKSSDSYSCLLDISILTKLSLGNVKLRKNAYLDKNFFDLWPSYSVVVWGSLWEAQRETVHCWFILIEIKLPHFVWLLQNVWQEEGAY